MKQKKTTASFVLILLIAGLWMVCHAAAPAPSGKGASQPPPPPDKVFEDGTPWKAVDQEKAIWYNG